MARDVFKVSKIVCKKKTNKEGLGPEAERIVSVHGYCVSFGGDIVKLTLVMVALA